MFRQLIRRFTANSRKEAFQDMLHDVKSYLERENVDEVFSVVDQYFQQQPPSVATIDVILQICKEYQAAPIGLAVFKQYRHDILPHIDHGLALKVIFQLLRTSDYELAHELYETVTEPRLKFTALRAYMKTSISAKKFQQAIDAADSAEIPSEATQDDICRFNGSLAKACYSARLDDRNVKFFLDHRDSLPIDQYGLNDLLESLYKSEEWGLLEECMALCRIQQLQPPKGMLKFHVLTLARLGKFDEIQEMQFSFNQVSEWTMVELISAAQKFNQRELVLDILDYMVNVKKGAINTKGSRLNNLLKACGRFGNEELLSGMVQKIPEKNWQHLGIWTPEQPVNELWNKICTN